MNNFLPQSSLLVQGLGWGLLQSLWQCLLIYGCLRIILAFTGIQHARLRYLLSLLSVTAMFAWFIDTCVEQLLRYRAATVLISQGGMEVTNIRTAPAVVPAIALEQGSMLARVLTEVQAYLPIAVALYLLGLAIMIARFGMGIMQLRRLRKRGAAMPMNDWQDWVQEKKEQLMISRPVQLFYSLYAQVPVTIGTLKPIILMPVAMAANLSAEQLEAILLHELAHIKRNDYLLNIFQATAETVLFFNPFVWLASGIVRREREHCCDDMVLSYSSGPMPYAKALAALEQYRLQNNSMALAATGNKNRLFNRIKRIMEMKQQKNNYTRSIIATLVIAALLICFAWLSPSLAQSSKSKGKTSSNKSTTSATHNTNNTSTAPKPPKTPRAESAEEAPEAPEAAEAPEAPVPPDAPVAPDDARSNTEEAMSNVDWDQMHKEMDKANKEMANVDWAQVGKEMDQAAREVDAAAREMANIDWSSMDKDLAQVKKELDAVNWDVVQQEIDKGLKEARESIQDPKTRKQVERSLELARKETERAMAQANRSLRQAELNMERQRANTHNSVSVSTGGGNTHSYVYNNGNGYSSSYAYGKGSTNAHAGGSQEAMLAKMEKEGLINRSRSYKVEKYGDRLYINGVLQPDAVYRRYSKYINAEHLIIKGSKHSISVSSNN